jgi:hypothetical protein
MPTMSLTLIVSVLVSLCVGGAIGAGVASVAIQAPACSPTPAAGAQHWQDFKAVRPLDDTGKTYR